MSVPYSLGPVPNQPPSEPSAVTQQLQQGAAPTPATRTDAADAPTTPLLAPADATEGVPETFEPAAQQQGAAAARLDPGVGHDSKLPNRICPGGYGCGDDS
jgi:hypothetical protein